MLLILKDSLSIVGDFSSSEKFLVLRISLCTHACGLQHPTADL